MSFVAFVSFVPFSEPTRAKQTGELIDRTLAIVGGQVITMADARTAISLRLVEPPSDMASATTQLVDRLLMLREVQRYAPPEPAATEIDERIAAMRARFETNAAFIAALEAGGFSEDRLRIWVRDDLRLAAYLNQRFAAVTMPTDDEVSAYYKQRRDEFDRDRMSFEQAAASIRERLARERRAGLIADWVADLRRRTPVVQIRDQESGIRDQGSVSSFHLQPGV